MNTSDLTALVSRHRNYFRTGATRSVEWRERQLIALRAMMTDRAENFYASLWTDLRRNRTDADLTDVKYLIGEVDHDRGVRLAHGPPSSATALVFIDPASLRQPQTRTNSLASSASPDWPRM